MTTLVSPHSTGRLSMVINGRTYQSAYGSSISVPDQDAIELEANGWLNMGTTGTTAQRPTGQLAKNQRYVDTTINAVIIWDGVSAWRSALTGAVV